MVATPIGNLRDITLRALDVLAGCDLLLAEDTRVARKLLDAHGVAKRPSIYNDHAGPAARARALEALARGDRVALISDAGTPLVSDPGYKLVQAAIAAGHPVRPIPGASAALAALVASGLPSDRFLFAGFPPAKTVARRAFFQELAGIRATLIFFESGPRLADSLADMAAVFGARPAAIGRELTKLYEEVRRGAVFDLAAAVAAGPPPKGEIVVLVGIGDEAPPDESALDQALDAALSRLPAGAAASEVAKAFGAPRRDVYRRALARQGK